MKLVPVYIESPHVYVHNAAYAETSLGIGYSKMGRRLVDNFVHNTTLKASGDLKTLVLDAVNAFVDRWLEYFYPALPADDPDSWTSMSAWLQTVNGSREVQVWDWGGGIGRTQAEYQWVRNEDLHEYHHVVRVVRVSGSGDRDVTWGWQGEDVDDALRDLADGIEGGDISLPFCYTQFDARRDGWNTAAGIIRSLLED